MAGTTSEDGLDASSVSNFLATVKPNTLAYAERMSAFFSKLDDESLILPETKGNSILLS